MGQPTPYGPAPRRLTPIFRDRSDLSAAGDLSGELGALRDSLFLIVVCSPAAAKSGSRRTRRDARPKSAFLQRAGCSERRAIKKTRSSRVSITATRCESRSMARRITSSRMPRSIMAAGNLTRVRCPGSCGSWTPLELAERPLRPRMRRAAVAVRRTPPRRRLVARQKQRMMPRRPPGKFAA